MSDKVLKSVERVLGEVDVCRDVDWDALGEKLLATVLDRPEMTGTFTEAQKEAIVAICRETYYAASVIAKAYAFKTAEILCHELG